MAKQKQPARFTHSAQPPTSLTAKQEDEKVIPAVKNAALWGQENTDPKLWNNFPFRAHPPHFITRREDLRAAVKKLPIQGVCPEQPPQQGSTDHPGYPVPSQGKSPDYTNFPPAGLLTAAE